MKNVNVLLFIYLMSNTAFSARKILLQSYVFWSKERIPGNGNKLKTEWSIWFCSAGRGRRGEHLWLRGSRKKISTVRDVALLSDCHAARHVIVSQQRYISLSELHDLGLYSFDGWTELNSIWKRKFFTSFYRVCLSVCLPGITDGLKLCSECSLQLCTVFPGP